MIGHGGRDTTNNQLNRSTAFSGYIDVASGGGVSVQAGSRERAFAMIGHGGADFEDTDVTMIGKNSFFDSADNETPGQPDIRTLTDRVYGTFVDRVRCLWEGRQRNWGEFPHHQSDFRGRDHVGRNQGCLEWGACGDRSPAAWQFNSCDRQPIGARYVPPERFEVERHSFDRRPYPHLLHCDFRCHHHSPGWSDRLGLDGLRFRALQRGSLDCRRPADHWDHDEWHSRYQR